MNEKRFIRNIVGDIYDSEKDKWFEEDWKGKPLDYDDDLIVFLNELSEEVGRLKKYCNSYKGIISQKNDRIKSLELKNNRLNADYDYLYGSCPRCGKTIIILREYEKAKENGENVVLVNKKDLKCGLGEMKPYYCKGDYIWLDENGNISSKSQQEFKKEKKGFNRL